MADKSQLLVPPPLPIARPPTEFKSEGDLENWRCLRNRVRSQMLLGILALGGAIFLIALTLVLQVAFNHLLNNFEPWERCVTRGTLAATGIALATQFFRLSKNFFETHVALGDKLDFVRASEHAKSSMMSFCSRAKSLLPETVTAPPAPSSSPPQANSPPAQPPSGPSSQEKGGSRGRRGG